MNKSIHIFLQPHPSVGKKYCSSLLEQYLSKAKKPKTAHIGPKDIKEWDGFIEKIVKSDELCFIIMVASSCYLDFSRYCDEVDLFSLIEKSGCRIINHYVFTPGRNGEQPKDIFSNIISNIKERVGYNVVWHNDNLGISLREYSEGKYSKFSDIPGYDQIENKIHSIIHFPKQSYCFEKDFSKHIRSGLNFDQAISDSKRNIVYRQRLYRVQKRIFKEIENAGF